MASYKIKAFLKRKKTNPRTNIPLLWLQKPEQKFKRWAYLHLVPQNKSLLFRKKGIG